MALLRGYDDFIRVAGRLRESLLRMFSASMLPRKGPFLSRACGWPCSWPSPWAAWWRIEEATYVDGSLEWRMFRSEFSIAGEE